MANMLKSLQKRFARVLRCCSSSDNFADVSFEPVHSSIPCEQPIPAHPQVTVAVKSYIRKSSPANLLLPPATVDPVVPVPSLLHYSADVQIYLIQPDDFSTEAELVTHNALNNAPKDDDIDFLSPNALWIPGQPRKIKSVSENAKRYNKKMDEFQAMLAAASTRHVFRPAQVVVSTPAPRALPAGLPHTFERISVVARPVKRSTAPGARRLGDREARSSPIRPSKAAISGPYRMSSSVKA